MLLYNLSSKIVSSIFFHTIVLREGIFYMAIKKQKSICPIKYILAVFGGKWKLPTICIIANGKKVRYGQIKRGLGSITNMMLSKTLKELEKDGVIYRKQYNEVPPHVEYTLSDAGKTILPVLDEMGNWAIKQMKKKNIMPNCPGCSGNSK